ncbi:PP2C family protein-serine/threonine phosphatase [Streptomyces sp. BPTC-684]|uniref:PP2C family protein-serine/threonine phosphatase n=1 Tax=Streptomyces sp. BPTC-684 TaxID=3043734 RepID=UPI0024B214B4|nr:PP2C family protein-serine/threonine phosphatase [Streptomyces sp. BPTC-684]WHM40367.1 PP2C family protein-serine/threonine phosphatase [Streptomyces sp. BPTC-684]
MDLRALNARRHPYHRLRHALLAAPFALIAFVTVGDILAPPDVHLGPFLVAAPALTASFAGPRTTGVVGGAAVLAQASVAMVRTSATDLNHSVQIVSLILISVFVTLFAHLREVREKELVQLRSVAETAQQVVLRPLRERIGPLRMASVYLAAEAEAQIGGDLYAAARTPHGTRLLIGDVRGKGLEAVGDAAVVLGAFRASAHQEAELSGLVAYLEGAVAPDLHDVCVEDAGGVDDRGEAFITAAVLDVPDDRQTLGLVNCGHPPPLLLRGGRVIRLDVAHPAPPLGLSELVEPGLAAQTFAAETFAFEEGDIMLLYTDGVIEARDETGTFYPLAERLAAWSGTGPRALLRHLCDDLLAHAAGHCLGDDAAMVAIERLG